VIGARPFATVVSGIPRSGTSLVMQMLSAGGIPPLTDGVRAADEDNPRGYLEYEPVKASARDVTWAERARGRCVKVVHALVRHLPESLECRVILLHRPIAQVLDSQAAMLRRGGREPAADGPSEARLGEVLEAQLAEVAAELAARPRWRVLGCAYPELVAEPLRMAREIDAFLGGGLDVAAMVAAVDPRLHRQRR
jgi:hypothetical protein